MSKTSNQLEFWAVRRRSKSYRRFLWFSDRHARRYHEGRVYVCSICDEIFKTQQEMLEHKRTEHAY